MNRIGFTELVQGYEKGGLRMTDIDKFIDALKISWIRREILEDNNCFKIHNSLYPLAQKILLYGNDFIKNNLDHIRNPIIL